MIASQLAMLMENVLLLQERDWQLLVLELEKNRVEAILRNMGEGVIVTDWSYNIIHSNPLAHTLLGLDAGELEGKLLFEHVPKEIFNILEEQPIGEINPTWNVRFQSVKEDFPLVASVAVVDEKGEQTLGLILLLRDITAERELDNLRSRFLENISNQIMNPLASLLGFKDLLEEELKENITSRQSEYLDVMGEEVTKLTEIVEDLLSLTRIELADFNLTPAAMPLAEAILAAISSLQNDAWKKEITLKTEIPPDLTEIYADRESVVDITSRVLSNAIKFSPPGVEVKVGARPIAEDGGNEMVEIYIKDPGPGIPVDRRDSLFEKYQSHKFFTEVDSRNVGLGLPICKRLVEMNGGRIGYSTPAEGGSEFHFTFPVREKVGA
jgi:PAS domain S-box-containing protein